MPILNKNCVICNTEFKPNRSQKTCSEKCSKELSKIRYNKWQNSEKEKERERIRKYYHDHKNERKEYNKKWSFQNSEYLKEKRIKLRSENPEKYKLKFKNWYYKNQDEQLKRAYEYRKNNPEKIKIAFKTWYDKKRKNDLHFKLLLSIRSRINKLLKYKSIIKQTRTIKLLGCTIPQLKQYLENKFQPGMSWENHGLHGWHIDHIVPCASFDLADPEQQKKCFHYTNLQPLWAIENIKKGAKTA
jgi:hypothetical protein